MDEDDNDGPLDMRMVGKAVRENLVKRAVAVKAKVQRNHEIAASQQPAPASALTTSFIHRQFVSKPSPSVPAPSPVSGKSWSSTMESLAESADEEDSAPTSAEPYHNVIQRVGGRSRVYHSKRNTIISKPPTKVKQHAQLLRTFSVPDVASTDDRFIAIIRPFQSLDALEEEREDMMDLEERRAVSLDGMDGMGLGGSRLITSSEPNLNRQDLGLLHLGEGPLPLTAMTDLDKDPAHSSVVKLNKSRASSRLSLQLAVEIKTPTPLPPSPQPERRASPKSAGSERVSPKPSPPPLKKRPGSTKSRKLASRPSSGKTITDSDIASATTDIATPAPTKDASEVEPPVVVKRGVLPASAKPSREEWSAKPVNTGMQKVLKDL
ncbi:hypothetical protein HK101_006751, partial [Irineochytrium annulatum]